MSALTSQFTRRYGAGPLHLIGHLLLLGVVGFALERIFSGGDVVQLVLWYLGFVLAQDLILVPLYTVLDRLVVQRVARVLAGRGGGGAGIAVNYVRVPALLSGLLFLVYAPSIFAASDSTFRFYSGHGTSGFLLRWALVSVALFLGSALVFAVRRVRANRRSS